MPPEACPKVVAIAELIRQAWREPGGRMVTHCILNGWIGADWDTAGAIHEVVRAQLVQWNPWAGHDLVVRDQVGRWYHFDVQQPEKAAA